jgi:hypothetical protein
MISARNYRTRVDATGTSTNSASTNSPSTNSIGPKQTGAAGFDVALDERVDRAEGVRDRERQVPIELLDRLLVDARIACRRDGVAGGGPRGGDATRGARARRRTDRRVAARDCATLA